jgi:hypothetical protein
MQFLYLFLKIFQFQDEIIRLIFSLIALILVRSLPDAVQERLLWIPWDECGLDERENCEALKKKDLDKDDGSKDVSVDVVISAANSVIRSYSFSWTTATCVTYSDLFPQAHHTILHFLTLFTPLSHTIRTSILQSLFYSDSSVPLEESQSQDTTKKDLDSGDVKSQGHFSWKSIRGPPLTKELKNEYDYNIHSVNRILLLCLVDLRLVRKGIFWDGNLNPKLLENSLFLDEKAWATQSNDNKDGTITPFYRIEQDALHFLLKYGPLHRIFTYINSTASKKQVVQSAWNQAVTDHDVILLPLVLCSLLANVVALVKDLTETRIIMKDILEYIQSESATSSSTPSKNILHSVVSSLLLFTRSRFPLMVRVSSVVALLFFAQCLPEGNELLLGMLSFYWNYYFH